MATKLKADKAPKLFLKTGEEAHAHRIKLDLTQSEFWRRIKVTQSGGSRYESGRKLSNPVQLLLHLTYAPEAQAMALLDHLRAPKVEK